MDWRSVPIPERLRHLSLDPRGYPIFAMAYRDASGRAHFTINDERARFHMIERDLCSICGNQLLRGRWFIGGEKSAFHPHGAYIDPPVHAECARYALRVCPYLAAPSYAKLIDGRRWRPTIRLRPSIRRRSSRRRPPTKCGRLSSSPCTRAGSAIR